MAHRIRLRQPWTRRVEERENPDAFEHIFERHFNRPTGIEPDDQIEIEVNADIGEIDQVRLNNTQLEAVSGTIPTPIHTRLDLSDRLDEHNVLRVYLRSSETEPELGDVHLWIRPTKNS